MYPDELQHRPGAAFLYTHNQRVWQLLIPVFLRNAHVPQLHVGPVTPGRGGLPCRGALGSGGGGGGGGLVHSGPDLQRGAVVRFPEKFLPTSRVLVRRAALPLQSLVCHDRAATEENAIAQIGAGQGHGEYEGESGAEFVGGREEPMCHVSMDSKRRMVLHRSPPPLAHLGPIPAKNKNKIEKNML